MSKTAKHVKKATKVAKIAKEDKCLRDAQGNLLEESDTVNDKELFNHGDFGEGGTAMASHVATMTGLQRMIFEDCVCAPNGDILAPHVKKGAGTPVQFTPEYLKIMFSCTIPQATELATAFEKMSLNRQAVDFLAKFDKEFGKLNIDTKIAKMNSLADELDKITVTIAEEMAKAEETDVPGEQNDAEQHLETAETTPETTDSPIGYHKIGDGIPEKDWFDKQPAWFNQQVDKIKNADLPALRAINKLMYDKKESLLPIHRAVLWNVSREAKRLLLDKIVLSDGAKHVFALMHKMDISKAGQMLHKIGKGEIKFDFAPLTKDELEVLWQTFKDKKSKLIKDNPFATATAEKPSADANPFA